MKAVNEKLLIVELNQFSRKLNPKCLQKYTRTHNQKAKMFLLSFSKFPGNYFYIFLCLCFAVISSLFEARKLHEKGIPSPRSFQMSLSEITAPDLSEPKRLFAPPAQPGTPPRGAQRHLLGAWAEPARSLRLKTEYLVTVFKARNLRNASVPSMYVLTSPVVQTWLRLQCLRFAGAEYKFTIPRTVRDALGAGFPVVGGTSPCGRGFASFRRSSAFEGWLCGRDYVTRVGTRS